MKSFLLIAFLVFNQTAGADTLHSVVRGENGEPHLVKYNSGTVEFINQSETEKLAAIEEKLQVSKLLSPLDIENKVLVQDEQDFQPTAVTDSQLKTIFQNMNSFMRRKSECSDRAHVWAWDEFERSGIKSEKAFLFLTDTYIRRHRYKWWFHVAPMFTTTSGKKMVVDNQFLDRPVTFNQWKNLLVFSKRECVTDFQFQDYDAGADQTQDCYTKAEPMFYRIPGDIGNRERGTPRTSFNASEVNAARSRAFFKGGN